MMARVRRDLFHEAMTTAQSLRSPGAGPRHLVLVLLAGPVADPARRALESVGLSPDQIRGVGGRTRRKGVVASPALMRVDGFARGLAVGRGERRATTTDHLVSLCWHPDYWLDDRDFRRAILRELKAEGVAVPVAPLPRWDPTRFTQRIEKRAHLAESLALLKSRYPAGTHPKWGFNYRRRGMAELAAEDGIDLVSIAATAAGDK